MDANSLVEPNVSPSCSGSIIRALVLCAPLLLFGRPAMTQCMFIPQHTINMQCQQTVDVFATVWSGVAPFDITVEVFRGEWQVVHQELGNPVGYFSVELPLDLFTWTSESRVTVTDATGCTATQLTTYPQTFIGVAAWNWNTVPQCNPPGAVVELYMPYLPTPPTYRIDGGPDLPFASGWTLVAPNTYRTNALWPTGNHTLEFPQHTQGGYAICAQSKVFSGTPSPCVGVTVRGALDGALPSGTLMTDALRAQNLIPVASTSGTIANGLLFATGNDAIVDRVTVELRSATNPAQVITSAGGLLQRDGDVVEHDGTTGLRLPGSPGNYHVALRHRNHLGVMTAAPVAIGADPASALVDFRQTSTAVYGTNARVLKGTVHCLWAGEARVDGTIKYVGSLNDRDQILSAIGGATPNNVLINVYDNRDVNLDGVIKYTGAGNDRDIILTNVGSTTPNAVRVQQLP